MTRTKSLLCHLVEAQVSRYLSGAPLSDEALAQLEDHLGACDSCREFLDRKKQELVATLDGDKPKADPRQAVLQAIVDAREVLAPKAEAAALDPEEVPLAIRPQRRASAKDEQKPAAQPNNRAALLKPALYSLGLAVVLIVMSAFARDPSSLFGRRAGDLIPPSPATAAGAIALEETLAPESADHVDAPAMLEPNGEAEEAAPTEDLATDLPTTEPTPEPTPEVEATDPVEPAPPAASRPNPPVRPAPRTAAPRTRTPAPAPATGGGIRVYDAQGRPIQISN